MSTARKLENVDYEAFGKELFALRDEAEANLSIEDYHHLRKIIWVNRLFTLIGYGTAWIIPNPISAYCISQGIFGRWLVMHHIGHGGYDKVPGMPAHMNSKNFAIGWRRFKDWFEWMYPPAWNQEHNVLHHYHTSEVRDPDLVEDIAVFLRRSKLPMFLKYTVVALAGISWKFSYYAPNTMKALDNPAPNNPSMSLWGPVWRNVLDFRQKQVRRLWLLCYLPVGIWGFVITPLAFYPLGLTAVLFVLINRIMAEFMTNFHSYMTIAPNHAGDDLYRFDSHFQGKGEYAVNQVISACNYQCGTPAADYLQIWVNYQIEHHLFPRLPMLKYRDIQPKVKEICERHGVPYVQEPVWRRFMRTVNIMVGKESMLWLPENSEQTDSSNSSPVTKTEALANG